MMRSEKFKMYLYKYLSPFVLLALVTGQNVYAQGSAAGKVVFAMGAPQAIDTGGTARNLTRGNDVFAGDRLVTGRGRLQVSMTDGAFISVQPNSEYVIDNYNYSGQPDGTEQAVYRLAKGGVRAVTGLIGRTNTEAYKVNTAVATIGIRGTGHNTRLCAGDCARGVRDGLYHNTWEGITYVVNDVDSEDVAAGQGVYVEDIDTPIVPLEQPSAVTAAVTRSESGREQEDDDRETQDQTTIIATGEQRNPAGDQSVVVGDGLLTPTKSEAITGLGLVGIHPADQLDPEIVDVFVMSDANIFKDPNGNIVGILGLVDEDFNQDMRGFGTIDLNAVLGADNPTLIAEIRSLLGFVNTETLSFYSQHPASSVDVSVNNNLGWGRWTDGLVLTVDEDGEVNVHELVDNQSFHFIFGPDPGTRPTTGTATYNWIGGTRSTSVSGATIGTGATGGSIIVNFAGSASLNMTVNHLTPYNVSGPLVLDTLGNGFFDTGSVFATGGSGACAMSCPVYIDGGFAGPDTSGVPTHIGLEYDIYETDVITGVAGFAR